ncbi:MAG: hypothetical protein CK426_01075 [Legionella sp.]|nr:MAG: hypothetical protein CK423_08340 [Legionella sp.]PJD99896.1 MAG: hypothetical protein CK426_01075 [Legionella sp.]
MTDLFEDDNEEVLITDESFDDVALDPELVQVADGTLDARRRLEKVLEERRLREELDDFMDY